MQCCYQDLALAWGLPGVVLALDFFFSVKTSNARHLMFQFFVKIKPVVVFLIELSFASHFLFPVRQ